MINIALAEDNILSRITLEEKLSVYPDLAVLYTASNGIELLEHLKHKSCIDLILMDIEMPFMNGIEATEKIRQLFPHIKIVMITIYDDDEHIFAAIKAGSDGYLLKEAKAEKIYEAISDTLKGGAVMSPSIALKTMQILKTTPPLRPENNGAGITLSYRESEILILLSKGSSNKIIAENLFISPFTVKRHIENIYQKLQAHNRIELLDKARKNGLI